MFTVGRGQIVSSVLDCPMLLADSIWSMPSAKLIAGGVVLLCLAGSYLCLRKRLKRIKPLWVCVILSFAAHLLLAIYFYGTTLVVTLPPIADVMTLQLVDHEVLANRDSDKSDEQTTHPFPKPWEQMSLPELSEPNSKREAIDVQLPLGQNVLSITAPLIDLDPEIRDDVAQPSDVLVQTERESAKSFLNELSRATAEQTIHSEPDRVTESRVEPFEISRHTANANLSSDESRADEAKSDLDDAPEMSNNDFPPINPSHAQDYSTELTPIEPRPIQSMLDESLKNLLETSPFERARPPVIEPLIAQDAPPELQPQDWRLVPAVQASNPTKQLRLPIQPAKIVREGDGKPLPEIYQARAERKVNSWLEIAGGSERTEIAVRSALDFFSRAQDPDGRWSAKRFGAGLEHRVLGHDRGGAGYEADTGVTGLALLSFLAAGHTHLAGEYRETMRKGLEYLLTVQKPDGSLAGDALLYSRMYCHSMATLALSEAYAMTGDDRLRPALQSAVNYSVRAQHPSGGGWRYLPGDKGDMSQFGWQVMALKSAQLGGIDVPDSTWRAMKVFLENCSSGTYRGLAAYQPGQVPTRVMTAEALLCRYFMEGTPNPALVREASDAIIVKKPGDGEINFYYWYYATYALNMVGGDTWNEWNNALKLQLLSMQRQDGPLRGSFDPVGIWCGYGGRIYSTALATLCLESYYRYLPMNAGEFSRSPHAGFDMQGSPSKIENSK
ncbi:MAG TPA: terpene cyclase/mutase family protein [Pirellulaceae bacterium]|nr:terpene cyclase/mutase family protein [Pirellulaceae bacterium]